MLDESNECSLLCVTSELHCASKSWVPLFWSIFHLLGWTLAQNSFLKHPPSVWTSNDGHGIENLWGWGTDTLDSTICDLKLFPNCKLWANFAKNGQRTHFLSALPPPIISNQSVQHGSKCDRTFWAFWKWEKLFEAYSTCCVQMLQQGPIATPTQQRLRNAFGCRSLFQNFVAKAESQGEFPVRR